jgi:hypothetical protein
VYLLAFHAYFTGILIFKGLTARRLYKSFGVKGLKDVNPTTTIALSVFKYKENIHEVL